MNFPQIAIGPQAYGGVKVISKTTWNSRPIRGNVSFKFKIEYL